MRKIIIFFGFLGLFGILGASVTQASTVTQRVGADIFSAMRPNLRRPITITATDSLQATTNKYFSAKFLANNGFAPYTFSVVSGGLPDGMVLSNETCPAYNVCPPVNQALLSGTTQYAGTFVFQIRATDRFGNTGFNSFVLTVSKPAVISSFTLTKPSFDFVATQGDTARQFQSLEFTNISDTNITYFLSQDSQPSWLTSGYNTNIPLTAYAHTPTGLGAGIDPSGLLAGQYRSAVSISGNFPGSPIVIPINLVVNPPAVIQRYEFTSPLGGEQLAINTNFTISWKYISTVPAYPLTNIYIQPPFSCPSGKVCPQVMPQPILIAKNLPGYAYTWKVGEVAISNGQSIQPGQYTLILENAVNVKQRAESNPFTIIEAQNQVWTGKLTYADPGVASGLAIIIAGQKYSLVIPANAQVTDIYGNTISYTYLNNGMTVQLTGTFSSNYPSSINVSAIRVLSEGRVLTFQLDVTGTPIARAIAPGSVDVRLTAVRASANNNGPITINSLQIRGDGDGNVKSKVTKVSVYDGVRLLASVNTPTASISPTWDVSFPPYTILSGTSKTFMLTADIAPSASGTLSFGISGVGYASDNTAPEYVEFKNTQGNPVTISPAQVRVSLDTSFAPNMPIFASTLNSVIGRFYLSAGQADITINTIKLIAISSANCPFSNLQLWQNGEQIAQASPNGNCEVIFQNLGRVLAANQAYSFTLKTTILPTATPGFFALQISSISGSPESLQPVNLPFNLQTVYIQLPVPSTSIQITSPVGGEVWQAGTLQFISWSTTNLANRTVALKLIRKADNKEWVIFSSVSQGEASGSFAVAWNVPEKLKPGNSYKVQICDTTGLICSLSNAPFTISLASAFQKYDISGVSAAGALSGIADGKLDDADIKYLSNVLAGNIIPPAGKNLDFNNDNKVDSQDLVLLSNLIDSFQ